VNRWENGHSEPRGAKLAALEEFFAAAGEELVLREEDAETKSQRRTKRGTAKSKVLATKSMEQMLWDCACSIRGEKEAPKFKNYLLPLVFLKRLSDVFDDEVVRLVETYGDEKTARAILEADHSLVRFYLPHEARWPVLSGRETHKYPKNKEPKTLGERLTIACRAVATHHEKLRGVIDVVDFNESRNNEREVSDTALSKVIQTLSDPRYRLGLENVEPDFLGRAYEYLLRKFAEGQGQSAGEFFTPQEVGWIMAYLMRPRQGETVHDYACGSAGLLIKCQLALRQREMRVAQPLKLFGQELEGASYAIAWMNTVIHDMDAEIVRGNSMVNPKFRDDKGRLKKFDIIVANPMWNQPFDAPVYENDAFERFEEHGGITSSKGDWAWLQHTLTCLSNKGRAAVVLDTGAVTRGSGSKNEDKEKKIRQWFVEQDVIEGVILLPDNLFYNTTAPGIIVVLNKDKPKARKGFITLVNASRRFRKGQPKNYIPDEDIREIAKAFHQAKDIDRFIKVITTKDAAKNDFNLSPSRYVQTSEDEEFREIGEIQRELTDLTKNEAKIEAELAKILKNLKVAP